MVGDFIGVRAAIAEMPPGTKAIHVLDAVTPFARPRSRSAECEAEAEEAPLAATLHYINNDEIQKRLKDPSGRVHRLIAAGRSDMEIVEDFYMAAFSRPTKEQYRQIERHLKTEDRRTAIREDVCVGRDEHATFLQRQ